MGKTKSNKKLIKRFGSYLAEHAFDEELYTPKSGLPITVHRGNMAYYCSFRLEHSIRRTTFFGVYETEGRTLNIFPICPDCLDRIILDFTPVIHRRFF